MPDILDWHEIEGNGKGNYAVEECKSAYQNPLFNIKLSSIRET